MTKTAIKCQTDKHGLLNITNAVIAIHLLFTNHCFVYFVDVPKVLNIALPSSSGINDGNTEALQEDVNNSKKKSKWPLLCWFDGLDLHKDKQEVEETEDPTDNESIFGVLPEIRLSQARVNAMKLSRCGNNNEAVDEKIKAIALVRIIYGDCSVQLSRAYAELAEGYLKLRKLPLQAKKHAENARDILLEIETLRNDESSGSENRAETAAVLELIYFVLGKASKSLKHYKKSDNFLQKCYLVQTKKADECGTTIVDTYKMIETLTLLGEVARLRKQNGFAMEWFEKAVELVEKKLGSESGELIALHDQIGKTELQLGKHANFERVYESYEKARSIASSVYGKTSVEYANSCASLAKAYLLEGDRTHSSSIETALEEAITVYTSLIGQHHKKTIDAEESLCRLYLQERKFKEAEVKINNIINGKVEKYGEISEQVADSLKMLGGLYLAQNKFKLAMGKLIKCQEIYRVVLGPQNKKTNNIAKIIESVKKTPASSELNLPEAKLKDRPRFNNSVSGPKTFAFTKTASY